MPTFENPSLKTNHLPLFYPLNCESSASARALRFGVKINEGEFTSPIVILVVA